MKTFLTFLLISLFISCANSTQTKEESPKADSFRFAFLTDIHLNNKDNNCFEGLNKAILTVKSMQSDFILTGGDNVDIDVLGKDAQTAHELFARYADSIATADIEFYPTMGNHDRFWGVDESDSLYNEGLFEHYIHESYYSFDHKGWHFIVLNSTQTCDEKYCVGEEQKNWLVEDLKLVDNNTPIIVSAHVPFLSVYYPALEGRYTDTDTFSNFKEIWDMFEGKNLKLVLQGHQHLYEEIKTRGVQFITGGAVSAKWWHGSYHGTEEGFLLIDIEGDEFSWKYVDYGWDVKK